LENTFWIVGQGDRVNFGNDVYYSSRCISLLVGMTPQERISLTSNVAED